MLLAMLIVFNIALLSLGNISATTDTINVTDSNLTLDVTGKTTNSTDLTNITNSTDPNSSEINSTSDTVNIANAAGDNAASNSNYTNIHGIWINSNDTNNLNIDALLKANITDIFVKINSTNYQSILNTVLVKVKGTPIRVNAWITCFKDVSGNWIDPQGKYSYQVKVPYTETVKTAYKQWYKGWYTKAYKVKVKKWYKSGKKWKYKWTYKTKYKRVYGWTYRWAYKTSYVTKYYYETQNFYSATHNNNLISFISKVATDYNINGIHLDYIRYSGVEQYGNAAYQQPGGLDAAVNAVTSFVANVRSKIDTANNLNTTKPHIGLSAALMPEGSSNAKYYGQDYTQLAKYLDFLVPMIYKGNYGYDSSTGTSSSGKNGADWIGSTVKYIVSQTSGTPVVAGLQTYRSDSNTKELLSANELQNDINAAIGNGSSGYVLFRYGLVSSDFIHTNTTNSSGTVTAEGTPLPPATSVPSQLQQYLQATSNCQVNDASIKSLAASITSGKTSAYDKAVAIFNWVRDNIGYSFYYNTKYGALGTLNAKTGNCVDTAHLLIALERAAGIPARYEHGYCKFSSGNWYGHVWAQVYVNGQWYRADASSTKNTFGVINSWNTGTATIYGTYTSLSF